MKTVTACKITKGGKKLLCSVKTFEKLYNIRTFERHNDVFLEFAIEFDNRACFNVQFIHFPLINPVWTSWGNPTVYLDPGGFPSPIVLSWISIQCKMSRTQKWRFPSFVPCTRSTEKVRLISTFCDRFFEEPIKLHKIDQRATFCTEWKSTFRHWRCTKFTFNTKKKQQQLY